LSAEKIVSPSKMSVIDIGNRNASEFGSLVLRQLVHQIVEKKNEGLFEDIPVLIIIDEVHLFYGGSASNLALGDLDTVCRTGRSKKIGVIFSSQDPRDLPSGINSVVNSKIFFRTEANLANEFGVNLNKYELNTLEKGFAAVSIHNIPQLKIVKFPLSLCGVNQEKEDHNEKQ